MQFALNHMCAPNLRIPEFFDLAVSLGLNAVEIRNDLAGNAILDGTSPASIKAEAQKRGITIISINALQRFNEWTDARAAESAELINYAAACGAEALVLVPTNDNSGKADGARQANLRQALSALRPLLKAAGIIGFVEPLGFDACSLSRKSEAVDAIATLNAGDIFRVVHDTFHHHLAGEDAIFPATTGLIHISGVSDPHVSVADMRDSHRVLVDAKDRLDNVGQIRRLKAAGSNAILSFEPFAAEVHDLADPQSALRQSIKFIQEGLKNN
jgi:2-keto-myo-inositol isomerase